MANLTRHFTSDELKCHHCGLLVKIDDELLEKLEELRALIGQPLIITSGYRCPEHNAAVGGAKDSYHIKGKAADIVAVSLSPAFVAEKAQEVGFRGIGIYPGWVHVDTREKPARWSKA